MSQTQSSDITLRIDGMHCGACIRRVTQALQSVAGAKVEEVRLGAARVQADPSAAEDLVQAVQRAGYSAQREE